MWKKEKRKSLFISNENWLQTEVLSFVEVNIELNLMEQIVLCFSTSGSKETTRIVVHSLKEHNYGSYCDVM